MEAYKILIISLFNTGAYFSQNRYLKQTASKSVTWGGIRAENHNTDFSFLINITAAVEMINYMPLVAGQPGKFLLRFIISFGKENQDKDTEDEVATEFTKTFILSDEKELKTGANYKIKGIKRLPSFFQGFDFFIYFNKFEKITEGGKKHLKIQIYLFLIKTIRFINTKISFKTSEFSLDIEEKETDRIEEEFKVHEEKPIEKPVEKSPDNTENKKAEVGSNKKNYLIIGFLVLIAVMGYFLLIEKKSVAGDKQKLKEEDVPKKREEVEDIII